MSRASTERRAVRERENSRTMDKTVQTGTKAARREAIRRKQAREDRKWYIIAGLASLVIVGLIAFGLIQSNGGLGRPGPIPGEIHVPPETPLQGHVQPPQRVTYQTNPPAWGSHYPVTAQYGVHTDTVQTEYWVHNLEHGGIVILYNCPQGCPDTLQQLESLYNEAPQSQGFHVVKMVITPYPGLKTQLMAIAWGVQLPLDSFDHDKLLNFYKRYLDQGPEVAM